MLRRVSFNEIEHNRLHETLDTDLAIVLNQLQERCFVLGPGLDTISFALKEAAK